MAAIERHRVLSTTRSGTIGALLTAIAFGGLVEVYAIVRKGERSVVGFVALLPFALLVVLLGMEATGLME